MNLALLIVGLVVASVVVVLILGLVNMYRGGSPEISQKLMRWRVGLQLVAVILVIVLAASGYIGSGR